MAVAQQRNHTRPKVGIYLRVSTDEQVREGFSLGTQETLCRQRCDKEFGENGYDVLVFRDEGYSGALGIRQFGAKASACRPGLSDLVDAIREGAVDTIVAWRLDRLLRNAGLWHRLLQEVLGPNDVGLIFLDQTVDTGTPTGRFGAAMLAAMASYQREIIGANIRDAHRNAMAQGYFMGYPPYGWERTPKAERRPGEHSTIRRSEEEGIWVGRMAEWYLMGWRTRRIVEELNRQGVPCRRGAVRWSVAQVLDVLKNPLHAGLMRVDEELIEGVHAPHRYYPPETYYLIVEKVAQRRTRHPAVEGRPKNLLTGLVTCGACGKALTTESTRHSGRYYRCNRSLGGEVKECHGLKVRADLLEKRTIAVLRDFHSNPELQAMIETETQQMIQAEAGSSAEELKQLRSQLGRVHQRMDKWDEELSAGTMSRDRWQRHNGKLQQEETAIQTRIEELELADKTRAARATQVADLRRALASFDECWDGLNEDERRELVHALVESLVFEDAPDGQVLRLKLVAGPEVALSIPFGKRRGAADLDPVAELTLRQMTVLWHIHSGLTDKEIGEKMGVNTQTIRVYKTDVRRRFGIHDVKKIAQMALPRIEECLDCLPLEGRSRRKPPEAPIALKSRDEKLLAQLAAGQSYTDIANERDVVVSTVQRHAERLYGVIGVRDRKQAEEWWKEREAANTVSSAP